MNELARTNPFAETLATLQAKMPETFALEVDSYAYRDVGSFADAFAIQRTMEHMKHEANTLGYDVIITHDYRPDENQDRWVYSFRRRSDAPVPAEDLGVEVIHLGEDSV